MGAKHYIVTEMRFGDWSTAEPTCTFTIAAAVDPNTGYAPNVPPAFDDAVAVARKATLDLVWRAFVGQDPPVKLKGIGNCEWAKARLDGWAVVVPIAP